MISQYYNIKFNYNKKKPTTSVVGNKKNMKANKITKNKKPYPGITLIAGFISLRNKFSIADKVPRIELGQLPQAP